MPLPRRSATSAAYASQPVEISVAIPSRPRSPWRRLGARIGAAVLIVLVCVALVYFDRDGYADGHHDDGLGLLDCVYYVTVTLSTTGYGDISPASQSARAVNAFVITPLRIAFLVLLIGTTLEVLAAQGRHEFTVARWRKRMKDHIVVVGYGIKGRSAIDTLLASDRHPDSIVVVDAGAEGRRDALAAGFTVVAGDATRREVLQRAMVERARQVIIATDRDDTNVLTALAVRQLNPGVFIAATVRDRDNVTLLRQSGADSVIVSADFAGRMLGGSAVSRHMGTVLEDLITFGVGIEVAERAALATEVGEPPRALPDNVIAVIRDEQLHYYFDPAVAKIHHGDRLVVIRSAAEHPWAPRPGTHGDVPPTGDVTN